MEVFPALALAPLQAEFFGLLAAPRYIGPQLRHSKYAAAERVRTHRGQEAETSKLTRPLGMMMMNASIGHETSATENGEAGDFTLP
jgi:hypothetical protein